MKLKKLMFGIGFLYTLLLLAYLDVPGGNDQKATSEEMTAKEIQVYDEALQYVNSNMVDEAPKIAITFDDGPSKHCTPRLLDGLKKRGVKATFFVIGENVEHNQSIVKRMKEEGHLIGNHTYHHVEITRIPSEKALEEIQSTSDLVESITGQGTEYMRPPFGLWQKKLEDKFNILPVLWTIDPLDWTTSNVDEVVNKVVTEAQEGDIILLHDCYDSSVDAALRIIDILKQEGYDFVTVDELILGS